MKSILKELNFRYVLAYKFSFYRKNILESLFIYYISNSTFCLFNICIDFNALCLFYVRGGNQGSIDLFYSTRSKIKGDLRLLEVNMEMSQTVSLSQHLSLSLVILQWFNASFIIQSH